MATDGPQSKTVASPSHNQRGAATFGKVATCHYQQCDILVLKEYNYIVVPFNSLLCTMSNILIAITILFLSI